MANQADHTQYYIVAIPTYGDPEKMAEDLLLRLARAVHHGVKAGCTVRQAVGPFGGISGPPVRLDPKGDDMGHHPGHDAPLVVAEP